MSSPRAPLLVRVACIDRTLFLYIFGRFWTKYFVRRCRTVRKCVLDIGASGVQGRAPIIADIQSGHKTNNTKPAWSPGSVYGVPFHIRPHAVDRQHGVRLLTHRADLV